MENNNSQNLFTEEELKILNFSKEEVEEILDADAIAKTAQMLPEEVDGILDRIDREFPDDIEGSIKKYAELAEKDPNFIVQLVAMNELFGDVKEQKAK